MQDRSNTGDRENPSWLGCPVHARLVGTRSADRMKASDHRIAQTGRTHSCTRPACITIKTILAKPGPSTHSQIGEGPGSPVFSAEARARRSRARSTPMQFRAPACWHVQRRSTTLGMVVRKPAELQFTNKGRAAISTRYGAGSRPGQAVNCPVPLFDEDLTRQQCLVIQGEGLVGRAPARQHGSA